MVYSIAVYIGMLSPPTGRRCGTGRCGARGTNRGCGRNRRGPGPPPATGPLPSSR